MFSRHCSHFCVLTPNLLTGEIKIIKVKKREEDR